MMITRARFVSMLAVLAAGCASVPLAPPQADLAAKRFDPPPSGMANLYVYRNENYGSAVRLSVVLDGALLGDTAAKTYLFTPIAPGTHTVVSKAENDSTAVIDARAGSSYFLWQEVKMGLWSARSALQQMEEAEGREGVKECKLGVTSRPAGCAKDADCKGDRVCEAGACVELRPRNN
jgi:hypothetical protein